MMEKPPSSEAVVVFMVYAVSPLYFDIGDAAFADGYAKVLTVCLFESGGEANGISGTDPAGDGIDEAIFFFAYLALSGLLLEFLVLLRESSGMVGGEVGLGLVVEAVGKAFCLLE